MNIRSESDVLGESVVRILDPAVFLRVKNSKQTERDRVYLAEYQRYVDQTVVYDKDSRTLVCIMRDVTDEELEKALFMCRVLGVKSNITVSAVTLNSNKKCRMFYLFTNRWKCSLMNKVTLSYLMIMFLQ